MNCVLRIGLLSLSLFAIPPQTVASDEIDFNRDVRPILSDKCYFCHGPDADNAEAGLRLDSRDEAAGVLDSGDLIKRIISEDPDTRMPPPESNLALTKEDRATLLAWIDQGAQYQDHWSFTLIPKEVPVPQQSDLPWVRQTLDRFVLARIDAAGSKPNGEADPLRWLRRVALDLTGLPPTAQQIADFTIAIARAKQGSPGCLGREEIYEAVVNEFLDSPAFGEHMAVAWLDSARYADSYGYQSDKLNTQWPYRDWVVAAFNDNLPYDEFLTWQIAGDLLDSPTQAQRLATAFNRIHRLNNEGGAVFEEWRIENVADRVHTFGTAVLGLTLECCRCHDHKYDPIPMRDYYSLSAFFNSIDESGVYDRTEKVPCPSLLLPNEGQAAALDQAKANLAIAEQTYKQARTKSKERWKRWKTNGPDRLLIPDLRLALGLDREFDHSIKHIYHPSESDRVWTTMPELVDVADSSIPRLDPKLADDGDVTGEHNSDDHDEKKPSTLPRRAMKLDGERGITTKGVEPLDRWMPFSFVISLKETKRSPLRSLVAHHTRGTDCGYNGWDLTIEDGYLESRMYRVWPGNAIGVRSIQPIPFDANSDRSWHQVAATYDGSSTAGGLKIYLDGHELPTTVLRDNLKKSCNVAVDHGGELVIGQRFRSRGFTGGWVDDVRLFTRELSLTELSSLARGTPIEPTWGYFASAIDAPTRAALDALTVARRRWVMAEEVITEIPVMIEMDEPRPAYSLARGQYDSPQNETTRVDRDTPSGLPLPFPDGASRDRRGLASWVTDPNHPLTSRVAVNRFWGNFFAEALVRTPENFGLQGELPTHPELLDWLARDFIDSGWDVKRFCRNVVLSATYRQDSAVSQEQLARDPSNRWLARGPAYRLAAEQIRDLSLAASGLLRPDMGGPPVSPYQPGKDLWKESNSMSPPFQQSVGESLHRRSLYSVWKRTAPLPNMLAFDSTSREVCTVKRSRTNTPLQALVLLNDVQFVEAARVLAEQLMGIDDEADRIDQAFIRLAGRPTDQHEKKALRQLFSEELVYYREHPDDAKQLIAIGNRAPVTKGDVASLAAMTTVCQTILNLDAIIWKR